VLVAFVLVAFVFVGFLFVGFLFLDWFAGRRLGAGFLDDRIGDVLIEGLVRRLVVGQECDEGLGIALVRRCNGPQQHQSTIGHIRDILGLLELGSVGLHAFQSVHHASGMDLPRLFLVGFEGR